MTVEYGGHVSNVKQDWAMSRSHIDPLIYFLWIYRSYCVWIYQSTGGVKERTMDKTFGINGQANKWSERKAHLVDLQALLHLVSVGHVVCHPLHPVQRLVGFVGRKALLVLALPVQVGLVVAGEADQAVPAALVDDHGGGDGLGCGVHCRLLCPDRHHHRCPGNRGGGGGLAGLVLVGFLWVAGGKGLEWLHGYFVSSVDP